MQPIRILLYLGILYSSSAATEARKDEGVDYFLKRTGVQKSDFHLSDARNGRLLVTTLDNFRGIFVWIRHFLLGHVALRWEELYKDNWDKGKIQKPRPQWEEFPCKLNNTRSPEPPKTVHELRPGDIDIIAAMGDSLSAGSGMISTSVIHTGVEYRGLSFSGGGIGNWRTALTLPNILKVFNPNLYGYATQEVLVVDRESHLNIAEPMIMSNDLVYETEIMIARMKADPRINMKNHWKLITLFQGNNDICSDMCHHDSFFDFLRRHENDLKNAFTLLRDNIPRLVINLLPVPNMVTALHEMKNIPTSCQNIHKIGCHCIFSDGYDSEYIRTASERIKRWQAVDEYVADLPEFRTDDFVILYQPYTGSTAMPSLANGDTDLRYFATDCFHFSQLGHAAMANGLWNSMLQAKGKKQTLFVNAFDKFECPTEDKPYIATWKNS